MVSDHVFISYISEDADQVDELQGALEAADFIVWRDKDKLWPGDDWQSEIRKAIRSGSLVFLACFSSNLAKRNKPYQFEELTLAAEEYRLRPPGASWLMTARLDECEIPELDLGAGRTLGRSIHRADLFGTQKSAQLSRFVVAIQLSMGSSPGTPPVSVSAVAAEVDQAKNDVVETLRNLLRNPSLVMDDDYLSDLREPIREALKDRDRFPLSVPQATRVDKDFAKEWVDRVRSYDDLLAPALVPLKLIAMYGTQAHEQELAQTIRMLAQESQDTGTEILLSVHESPALVATYVVALGTLVKQNYSMLRSATSDVRILTNRGRSIPFILASGSQSVIGIDQWLALGTLLCLEDDKKEPDEEQVEKLLTGRGGRRYTPISDHLYTLLAPLYQHQFAGDSEYAEAFDRVEVILDAISRTHVHSLESSTARTEVTGAIRGGTGTAGRGLKRSCSRKREHKARAGPLCLVDCSVVNRTGQSPHLKLLKN